MDSETFFPGASAPVPVFTAMDDDTKTAWGISGFPNVRVIKDGKLVGDSMAAVKEALTN